MTKKIYLVFTVALISLCSYAQIGTSCENPLIIGALPYQHIDNTGNYGNSSFTNQGTSCGTIPTATNYLAGNEVYYSYTASESGSISVSMSPVGSTSINSSIFVYNGCSSIGVNCIAGMANSSPTLRSYSFDAVAGQTYTIVISSSISGSTIGYNFILQKENCTPKPNNGNVSYITLTSAQLHWESDSATSWEVAVQPLGSTVPTGNGVQVSSTTYVQTNLNPATQYQFWVRSECAIGSNIYSAWAGPYPFNTAICDPSDQCAYTFRLTDTGNNGWGTNRMQVRQNGIVVATLGSQLAMGGGPMEVTVLLCPDVPFELIISAMGSSPNQCIVSILNPFTQTIYTRLPSTSFGINEVLYSGTPNCSVPECSLAPTGLDVTNVTNNQATFSWTDLASDSWDIYLTLNGDAAPTASTSPTIDNISQNSYNLTGLIQDTSYNVYVRNNCGTTPSEWSEISYFTTVTTCHRPSGINISNVTTDSAVVSWTKALAEDNLWEVFIIPDALGLEPTALPELPLGSFLFVVPDFTNFNIPVPLMSATIYRVYVRTVCSSTNKSNWTGGYVFNTVSCDDSQKCNYKFILTSTGANTWSGGRMQVRQNGILVTTLGASSVNNSNGIAVALCNDIPFDLYWSVAGTTPENIGIKIVNPFADLIFTKLAGEGMPSTSLFSSTGSCTVPSCAKPQNMTATNITANSVVLGWSSEPNSLYDLYVVPLGAPAPTNDPATQPNVTGVSNLHTLTQINGQPLSPSTTYTYYVRKVCSGNEKSTWTALNPVNFTTTPTNDECINASIILVNNNQECANSVDGTTVGATVSLLELNPPLSGANCNVTSKDIWYKFTALNTSQTIVLDNVSSDFAINFSLFSGGCSTLNKIGCYSQIGILSDLTVGDTYYLRVYGPSASTVAFAFNICITSPPANDNCENSVMVQTNPGLVDSQFVQGNTLGASASLPAFTGAGCTSSDDDVWFHFTATSQTHVITVTPTISNLLLNYSILSGDCEALTNVFCSSIRSRVAQNLVVGQSYKIRVYTPSLSVAGIRFSIAVTTPSPISNDDCVNATPVAINENGICGSMVHASLTGATASGNPSSNCIGTPDDDVWFSFVATAPKLSISLLEVSGQDTNINHSVLQGNCGSLTTKYCSAANSLSSVNAEYVVGQTYYIRVWSNIAVSIPVNFGLCVKSISNCGTAEPFCGSSPDDPFIFPNTTGFPDNSQVACLGSIPNPIYYTLHVAESGNLAFEIEQYESYDVLGQPVGQGLDVDYTVWGPFVSASACDQIVFADCPSCPNNTVNPTFYPFGNIVDCSYSTSQKEIMTISNAVAGEYYVVLITNFENDPGYIKLSQTNFGQPGAGVTQCADKIQLIAFLDSNSNGLKDVDESNFPYGTFTYQQNNTGSTHLIASPIGKYNLYDTNPANTYNFGYQVYPEFASFYQITPTAFNDLSIAVGSGSQNLYFPITPLQAFSDFAVTIVPVGQPVAGFNYTNKIVCSNLGTSSINAVVNFTKDTQLTIISQGGMASTANPDVFSANVILAPFETKSLIVKLGVPSIPTVNIGDILINLVSIVAPAGDINPVNNASSNSQIVVASYDPNDKMEAHGGKIEFVNFSQGDYLNYTIRFQNTGTYKATDIRIEDLLDAQFDPTSVRMENASHNYTMEIIDNKIIWHFVGIDLPPIVQNEPLSHGYINFRIKLNPGFAIGDVIPNEASIYFDSNPPIITNTFNVEFVTQLSVPNFDKSTVMIYPNPTKSLININSTKANCTIEKVVIYDLVGKAIRTFKVNSVESTLNVSDIANGVYLIEITGDENQKFIHKLVKN